MIGGWLGIIFILSGFPQVQVNWDTSDRTAIDIVVPGVDKILPTCLQSGLELRYRFEVQVCKRRPLWFDSCGPTRIKRHSLEYDPITQSYRLTSDWLGDRAGPITETFTTLNEASAAFQAAREVTLEFLADHSAELMNSRRLYLSVRIHSGCKGGYNETLARISSFLSLGLVRISGFDTGWLDFRVERNEPVASE